MIEAKISEKGTDRCDFTELPLRKYEFIDVLDKARIYGEYIAEIGGIDDDFGVWNIRLSDAPTIDELNFFAKKHDEIKKDYTSALAFRSLVEQHESVSIAEAINYTYGLEGVPVYPCENTEEYGKIVLDNELLEELSELPDELYEMISPEKAGEMMQKREGGVFISSHYAIPTSYEPQLVYTDTLPEKMEDWLFKLDVTAMKDDEPDEDKREALELPATEERLKEVEEKLGIPLTESVWVDIHSEIDGIDDCVIGSMDSIYELNELANTLAGLPRREFAKFKAVLDHEHSKTLSEISSISMKLDNYEFEPSVTFMADYGEKYLAEMLPPEFDRELLNGEINASFARSVAAKNGVCLTDYGAITHEGGHLYSMIEAQGQTQNFTQTM